MINKNKINKPSFINSENFYKSNYEKSWVICLMNIVVDKCSKNKNIYKEKYILEKYAPSINMILVSNEIK